MISAETQQPYGRVSTLLSLLAGRTQLIGLIPAPNTAQDASDAANACLAQDPVGGVFTPTGTAPVSTGSATGTASRTGAATGGASAAASSGATSAGVQLYRGFGWVAGSGLVTFGFLLGGTSALML